MKIAICVDCLTHGGAERVAAMWAIGFCEQGHDVSLIISNTRLPITYQIPETAKIYSVDINIGNGYLRHFFKILFQAGKLKKIFKSIAPDVVIAVQPVWGPLIYKSKGDLKFKVIGTDHSSYERPASNPMPSKTRWLKFEFNKKFDAVTVLTQADMNIIGGQISNVTVLPNPLSLVPVTVIPQKAKTILAVGRLDSWFCKGFDVLLAAWAKLSPLFQDWKLQIAGGGSGYGLDYLKKLCKEHNILESVEFLGFKDDIQSYFSESSIFVLSSRYEGFGLVLIEAMSQGCACIACDYKGRQSEIIRNEEEGLLCQPERVDQLVYCIRRLLTDDVYRRKVQEGGVKRSYDYQLNNIMQKWKGIFDSISIDS